MQIAFYKGTAKTWYSRLVDRAIRWWTKGPYSHCELIFTDRTLYASRMLTGCVYENAPLKDLKNWDYVEVNLPADHEEICKGWALSRVWRRNANGDLERRGYDWAGIFLSQILELDVEDGARDFCSETVIKCLQQGGMLQGMKPQTYSPNDLARAVGLI